MLWKFREENSFERRLKLALEIEMESPRKIPVTTKNVLLISLLTHI
jgi:hypothetical protein